MSDSETTGWRNGGRACDYMKDINSQRYEIYQCRGGNWVVWTYNKNVATERLLADAKRAAHAHARSKHE